SMSGSEFVEMFVGLGASRMRDLFVEAKKRAPCIVFIDELDAIGKSRAGTSSLSGHDEREQTLNQLLVEMDGFIGNAGVIIMAATNRPEVLDPALLRAGRFDRQVLVDSPDLAGREAILKVHLRTLRLDEEVVPRALAQRTPGMVGADLAKVVNEAALAGARRGSTRVAHRDFEEAIDRIQLGLEKKGRALTEAEKKRVAYHESGHTVVALSVDHANPVHRVTIIPRSIGALGVTLQLPSEERYLMTRDELLDRIAVMMGGRVAEEVAFGDMSTGAHNDLERATETARAMVMQLGMSHRFGPVTFGRNHTSRYLEGGAMEERNFSEQTAQEIDAEVCSILEAQYLRARQILDERRCLLEKMTARLLEVETLDRPDVDALIVEVETTAASAP
ncbi:MAG TPA: AAA family ATPase, partial [Vicinamibacteria bacterium]|nr:AAA family ATPase [Vicinamibacteria bacterium]